MTATPATPPVTPPDHHPERNRLREDNPDYQWLQRATQARLTASLRHLVRALEAGDSVPAAQRAFIQRHTAILAEAYRAAYALGTRHYYQSVSRQPERWATHLAPPLAADTLRKRLTFYAAGSVHKMATEAAQAQHDALPRHGALGESADARFVFAGPDAHGHWHAPAGPGGGRFEGGHALEHASSQGGHLHVEQALTGKGYHVGHVDAQGAWHALGRNLPLAEVNRLAKAHGVDLVAPGEKLTGKHFPAASASSKAVAQMAAVRARVNGLMATREDLYLTQHHLLAQHAEMERQQRESQWAVERAENRARIDLYHQSLDRSDPAVQRYFKDLAARAKAQDAMTHAKAEMERLTHEMDRMAAAGFHKTPAFAAAKAAYAEAEAAYAKANKQAEKTYGNLWTKSPSVYKPEADSIAGFAYRMRQQGTYATAAQVAAHPFVAEARATIAALPREMARVQGQLQALEPRLRTLNSQVQAGLTRLRTLQAALPDEAKAPSPRDTMRSFNDVLPLPEGHQPPNAVMQQLDYHNREPRAVTKTRIIDNITARLKDNAAWQEYVARMPTPTGLGIYHDYVHVQADPRDTKSAKLVADTVRQWGIGYRPGSPKWVALQTAVRDEFGLDAQLHRVSAEELRAGEAFYHEHGPAYRAFVRAMYENTQAWFAERGIHEVELYRGFSWSQHDASRPADITWGTEADQHHGVSDLHLNPFQSFSADINIAQGTHQDRTFGFATGGAYNLLIGARVPVDRILSTAQTGFGAKLESEVVVMGRHTDTVAYRASSHVAEAHQRQAQVEHVTGGHTHYRLPDGTTVHVVATGGTFTVTYHEGPAGTLGGLKAGRSKTYKTEQGVNKLLRSMRIGNAYHAPEETA